MSSPEEFYALVLDWLKRERSFPGGVELIAVTKVDGYGSDWEGSTEAGFYSTFNVTIHYTKRITRVQWTAAIDPPAPRATIEQQDRETVTGEDAASLWSHVVNTGWPGAFTDKS